MNSNRVDPRIRKMLREQSFMEPVVKNPFYHKLKWTAYQRFKIVFNCIFLLPIRVICILVVLFIAIIVSLLATCCMSDEELNSKPLKGWRKRLSKSIKYLGRAFQFFAGFHYIKINGKPATKQEATIFAVAPHSSVFDLFLAFTMDMPCAVTKIENTKIPVIGRVLKAMQPISVTREDTKNRMAVIDEIKKRSDPASEWPQVIIFPEGTCTNRTCLISFKPGAFIPGVPVQPVAVKYSNKFDTVTWTWDTNVTAPKSIFYTLCQFHNYLEITFLPVYHPTEADKADAKLFANNVRDKIAQYLKVPVTNHTFEDVRLMLQAEKNDVPIETGLIEFAKIKDKLGLKYENCQDILEKFIKIAPDSKGKLNIEQFCQYLDLPVSEPVKRVFNMYDRDNNGYIDFREFLIGLSILSQPVNNEETLKSAFKMFDIQNKGYISLEDLQTILYSAFSMQASEVESLFRKVDSSNDGHITFDEFKKFAAEKPEYARIFLSYNEFKSSEKLSGISEDNEDEEDKQVNTKNRKNGENKFLLKKLNQQIDTTNTQLDKNDIP